jgi:hypothetical protein
MMKRTTSASRLCLLASYPEMRDNSTKTILDDDEAADGLLPLS